MAQHSNIGRKIYYDKYDVTGNLRSLSMKLSREEKDVTPFGVAAMKRMLGIESMELTAGGFHDAADDGIDEIMEGKIGTDALITVCESSSDGAVAYFTKGATFKYSLGGRVTETAPFDIAAYSQGVRTCRGLVLATGAKTATGNGTGRQLGAVTATQHLYAGLHVTAVSGGGPPEITVALQSDDNASFTSPTTRVTFSTLAVAGSQWATPVAGAITDTWWRMIWTVSGSSPSFTLCAVAAIL